MKKEKNNLYKKFVITILILLMSSFVNAFTINDIVAHISFDENSSTLLNSRTPLYNASVLSGTVFIDSSAGVCKNNGCRNYTASSNSIRIDGLNNIMKTNQTTINCWYNIRSKDTYDNLFHSASSTAGANPQIYVMYDNPYANYISYVHSYSPASYNLMVTNYIANNVNTMITLVINNSHQTVYYNGVYNNSNNTNVILSDTAFNYVGLGYQVGNTGRAMNGLIDECTIFNKTLNESEINNLYIYEYPFEPPSPEPLFINQTPSDITTLNAISAPVLVYYNMSGLNTTTARINYTTSQGLFYINGTDYSGIYRERIPQNCTGDICVFLLDDNDVYPATYNINETVITNTPHDYLTLNNNDIVKTEILNVSNISNFNILEVMVNSTSEVIIYYCNSSYNTGVPILNTNCAIVTEGIFPLFNHTHTYSKHNVFSLPFINGKLGSITVTSKSYILVRSVYNGYANLGYINGTQRSNMVMLSKTNGLSYTERNITPDLHIHIYSGTEYLNYTVYAYPNNSLTQSISDVRTDLLNIDALSPTSPQVYEPTNKIYTWGENFNVSWIQSIPYYSYITNYNITLVDDSYNHVKNLGYVNNTTLILNNNNFSGLPKNTYYVKVTAIDNNSLTSYGLSEALELQSILYSPCNETITLNSTGVNVYFNWSTDDSVTSDEVEARINNVSYGFTVSTQGDNLLIGSTSTSFYLYFIQEYNDSTSSDYYSDCILNVCVSEWTKTTQPCIDNLRLINYTDSEHCSEIYDLPSDNGLYEDCVLPSNTDKELWIIIILIIFWILSIIVTLLWLRIFIIITWLLGILLWFYTSTYFSSNLFGILVNIVNLFILILAVTFRKN